MSDFLNWKVIYQVLEKCFKTTQYVTVLNGLGVALKCIEYKIDEFQNNWVPRYHSMDLFTYLPSVLLPDVGLTDAHHKKLLQVLFRPGTRFQGKTLLLDLIIIILLLSSEPGTGPFPTYVLRL